MTNRVLASLSLVIALPLAAQALADTAATPVAPDDPYFTQQWGLHNDGSQIVMVDVDDTHTIQQAGKAGVDIGWLDAQAEIAQRAKSPVIAAVIDSGIDPTQPDLQGRIAAGGWDFLKNTGSFVDSKGDGTDDMGHGTHVSGIIAAATNDGIGIAGVAPSTVQVLPLRVLSVAGYDGFTYYPPKNADGSQPPGVQLSTFASQAIDYAVAHHASVINMSLGWPKLADSQAVRDSVQKALAAGVLVVVSAGNDHKDQPTYPCNYEGVLCVGAISNNGAMSIYSNTGGDIDVLAPGDDIISTYPLNVESQSLRIQGYEKLSGTSQASPHIVGIAATLKSINPQISIDEIKARILVSASEPPTPDAALYGLANLQRAIDAPPQPVYLPDFKGIDSFPVDPETLTAQGSFTIRDLWAADEGVTAQVVVNGKPAGSASPGSVAADGSFTVPWSYQFASLDDASNLNFTLHVSDRSGLSKDFQFSVPAVRPASALPGQKEQPVTPAGPDWFCSTNGIVYSTLQPVGDYPTLPGMPAYYHVISADTKNGGATIEIFDPSSSPSVHVVTVPSILLSVVKGTESCPEYTGAIGQAPNLTSVPLQVVRMDMTGDGSKDWLIAGMANTSAGQGFQFYFLNSSFQPLWGASSSWLFTNGAFLQGVALRDYSQPATWIASGQSSGPRLVPGFFAQGQLPDPDNFGFFDPRHYDASLQHLYYLVPSTPAKAGDPSPLTLRALDNADFRHGFQQVVQLESPIEQSPADEEAGHVRIFLGSGNTVESPNEIWDIESLSKSSTSPAPGWDTIGVNGSPVWVISPDSSSVTTAFLGLFDTDHGALTWATTAGQYVGRTDFDYLSEANPFRGLVGVFDLGTQGRYWFVETHFQLVGYHASATDLGATPQVQTLPIDWDSSLPNDEFAMMFSPILVGTTANPVPGTYIDQTLVRGNRIAIAVWNPATGTFSQPLRYSLGLPDGCIQRDPIHLTAAPESVALPLLCNAAGKVSFELVTP